MTRPDGLVVRVWDFAGERAPISAFWQAAREADADVDDESDLAGAREGHLSELFQTAGLRGWRRRRSSCPSSTRPSTTGGSPSSWGSGPPAPISLSSRCRNEPRSGSAARRSSPCRRSR